MIDPAAVERRARERTAAEKAWDDFQRLSYRCVNLATRATEAEKRADGAERYADVIERTCDRLIAENRDLRTKLAAIERQRRTA
jgi:hypothetical protein